MKKQTERKQIDFVGKRAYFIGLSVVMMAATGVLFFKKGLNYGIDFTGGAEVEIKAPLGFDISKVRDVLANGGLKEARVVQVGEDISRHFLIKAQGDDSSLQKVSETVQAAFLKAISQGASAESPGVDTKAELKQADFEVLRADVVGPAAGESLRTAGFLSMLYALICILIYVTIRFDARYSPGAVLALFHDTVITIGIFILTQKQFDLQILAAILALIGYSNNDTIIVYDRIRETLASQPGLAITTAVNRSINETLQRTILTSLTTMLSVVALYFFGGPVIRDFAFTLIVGIFVGTYSSIFIASSFIVYFTQWQERRATRLAASGKLDGKKKKQYHVRPEPRIQ